MEILVSNLKTERSKDSFKQQETCVVLQKKGKIRRKILLKEYKGETKGLRLTAKKLGILKDGTSHSFLLNSEIV